MTNRLLSIDQNGFPIQTMSLVNTPSVMAVTAVTDRVTLPAGTAAGDILRIAMTVDSYFAWGDVTITASSADSIFTAGVEVFKIPTGATHLAAVIIGVTSGRLSVTELE